MDEGLLQFLRIEYVVIGGIAGVMLLAYFGVIHYLVQAEAKRAHLRHTGLVAEATIITVTHTALSYEGSSFYLLELDVKIPFNGPYPVRLMSRTHDWNTGAVKRGLQLEVRVDPDNPQRIAVVGPLKSWNG
ncbi:DUF3592 domain-containing protein [Myxococcus sp. SDU36]|uniref:DUF3592 domain-containing protein n=1 Tax=Myxococcus sp. SDU36 TaxID=2831967 RepID=UPI002543973A|nr:DUF3592 domain-containing protein [Myxococcus sp. SDU36]WIG98549.1 DUF3592 domain-containing protein [Myxococcus sp. SDU36]